MLEHKHLIIHAEVNNPPKNEELACKWILELVDHIDMKILMGPFAKYLDVSGNRGLTVAAIIETSHIVLHSWDESNPAIIELDVYSCGPLVPEMVFEKFKVFDPIKIEYKFLDREGGLKFLE